MEEYIPISAALDLPQTQELHRQPNRNTILRAIKHDQIPAIKPGQDYLIKRADFLKWLSGYPHPPGYPKGRPRKP